MPAPKRWSALLRLVSAVGLPRFYHVKEDAVIALRRCIGLQDAEVGDAMHQAVSIPGGQLQVGYYAIGRVIRVNGKMGQPIYLPVGSGVAKNRSIGKGPGGANLQSGNCHGSYLPITELKITAKLRIG